MWRKLKTYTELIKFEHTLFSLPFAFVGGILAARGLPSFRECFFITLAVVGARSAAMALNRLADRDIDAKNPRTCNRALPQKRISVREVLIWITGSLGLVIFASWQLNPICLKLLPIAVLVIFFYSYTKRFTWCSHLFLGLSLGLAPVGSWIAIRGSFGLEPFLIGLGVVFWTAGFDIIYSTLDLEYDLQEGLYSIPARFGLERAFQLSLIMHMIALGLFSSLKFAAGLGKYYLVALWVVGILLLLENWMVSPKNLNRVNLAFFHINSMVSITILIFTLLELGL
ncbi:MAG: putative 4-hydroxybenzoate polyprenyltransferase [Halanaerobiales bacterium]|nr:putative 4-hydroxybenzoate polyprenyltransferase [Halanaerobiales bacterium]